MSFFTPAWCKWVAVRLQRNSLHSLSSLLASLLFAFPALAQTAAPGPNSDPAYQALRNLSVNGDAVSVSNVELKRDAGTFHLHSGTVCFAPAVNGKVTGAVFNGDGNFVLEPAIVAERNSLKLLTKEDE